MISFLENLIGEYTYYISLAGGETVAITDWAWIMSAAFLLLVTWGIIIIFRSVISRG